MTWPRSLLALFLLVLTARVAAADDAPALKAAKQHFERGQKLYALTKFREALDEYQQAYEARPIPDFLFNIGQCYRNLGDYDSAIFSYKQYLVTAPDAPNRAQVEQLIGDLQAKKDQEDARRLGLQPQPPPAAPPPATAPAAPTPPAPAHRPLYAQWWFWTGVGVIAGGAGVATYELTRSKSSGPPMTTLGNIVFGR